MRVSDPASLDATVWDLPRGQHGIAAATITASQRARILYGVIEAVADKGYTATTVSDIIRIAGVSRVTFYQLFKDKEDGFIAAYEQAHHDLVHTMAASQRAGSGWAERVRDSVRAYLGFGRDQPRTLRALMVQIHAAGDRAWAKRDWGHARIATMQRKFYELRRKEEPQLPELPEEIFRACIAGIEELVIMLDRRGRVAQIMELEPTIYYLLEAIYGGHPVAARHLKKRPAKHLR